MNHLNQALQKLRDAPKAEGKERIYTHGEKEVFAVDAIFDKLMSAMETAGAYRLNREEIEKLNKRLDIVVSNLNGVDTLERRIQTANQKVINDLRAEVSAAIKKANERVDPVTALRARLKES